MADLALSGTERRGGERHQVIVQVDQAALAGGDGDCELTDGPAIAPETARRLACDSSLRRSQDAGDPTGVRKSTETA